MSYYKFLTGDNKGEYSHFDYTPYLPDGEKPGAWLPEITEPLELCEVGYHACEPKDLLSWINMQLFEVEFAGATIDGDDKSVGCSMRLVRKIDTWNDRTARLFAVWCARNALKLIANPDPRSIAACDVAERYANGEATDDERDAASDAARDAARAAAWDAASAAQSKKLLEMLDIGGG